MSRKKNIGLQFAIIACIAFFAVSCSKKLDPLSANLFTANPSPLEVVGSKVPVTITGKIPAKWFKKNAELSITPILKYEGGEAYGTTFNYQGENVSGNGIVVPEATGANITMYSEFDFKPEMQTSELYLRFNASIRGRSITLPDVKIADGVKATATLATFKGNNLSIAPDKFQKMIQEAYDAEIMFLIEQAVLRSSELNSNNLAAWKKLVEDAENDSRKQVNVEVSAYASPDGGFKLNEALAEKREINTTNYLEKEFKKQNISPDITAFYTAQDWEGFRKLVEASSIQDKNLILSVLSMYDDPEIREREIRNISAVFEDIAETILPQLRRSRLTANIQVMGKSDEEIKSAISKSNFSTLSLEELLYSTSLITDSKEKEKIYCYIMENFPNDYRAWNNVGVLYLSNGLVDEATKAFNRAIQIKPNAPESNVNLALIAISNNDLAKAEQLLGNASGANALNEALGLLQLKKGEYSKAVQTFGDVKTNNAAIAQILTNDYSRAQKTLDAISKRDAKTYYLGAIVAARTNNTAGVVSNLKESIKLDPSLKITALSDLEFSKFLTNPDILNMLR